MMREEVWWLMPWNASRAICRRGVSIRSCVRVLKGQGVP